MDTVAPAVAAPSAGETSGLRSTSPCVFYENANGNLLEIRESRSSLSTGSYKAYILFGKFGK